MPYQPWDECYRILQDQLKPHGYCGHLMSHFDSKKTHLENIIKRTTLMSESNSVLLIGRSGSGKSSLLECVLQKVLKDQAINENLLQVWLDGLIHIDDNIALEDITRQLNLGEGEDRSLGSFSEKLRLLLATLKSGSKKSKSVLFVLDNFELFSSHKNQTLLYNLFDIAQSRQTPICIIGLCSQPDVLKVLENRVKSRFSHQQILLFDGYSLDEYIDAAKYFLSLHTFKDNKFQKRWNSEVTSVLKEKSVKNVLEGQFDFSAQLRDLKNLLYYVIENVDSSQPKLKAEYFVKAYDKYHEDSHINLILDLSVLEVALLIAMTHLTELYDGEAFNFKIIFNEVGKFFRNRMKYNIEESVVRKSFEHLLHLELVKACSESLGDSLKNYIPVRLMVYPHVVKAALAKYQNLPGELRNWTESSLNTL